MIHPHISQKTEGFIPLAVDASYIIFIDLRGNNTSRLQHNRGVKSQRQNFQRGRKKVNYAKPQSQFDCYNHLIWGVDLREANLFWHLLWGICGLLRGSCCGERQDSRSSCLFLLLKSEFFQSECRDVIDHPVLPRICRVKSFGISQICKWNRWARKKKWLHLSIWVSDEKIISRADRENHYGFCSANLKVNPNLPGRSPPQTSAVASEPPSPQTVFVAVRKKINNYASTHCISWW